MGIFVRLQSSATIAAALPPHRYASARQRISLKIIHAGTDRTAQLILIVGVLFFVHEAPTGSAANDRQVVRRTNRPMFARTFSACAPLEWEGERRLELVF